MRINNITLNKFNLFDISIKYHIFQGQYKSNLLLIRLQRVHGGLVDEIPANIVHSTPAKRSLRKPELPAPSVVADLLSELNLSEVSGISKSYFCVELVSIFFGLLGSDDTN